MSNGSATLADLRPGDIMFGPIGGIVPGVFPVGVGQLLLANRRARLTWRRWWRIRHVGVVVEAMPDPYCGYGPTLVQAMPHGAEEILLDERHWTSEYVYIRPAYEQMTTSVLGGVSEMKAAARLLESVPTLVAAAARGYVGTPYNFLTYGKLAAGVLRMRATEALLRRWISTRRDMMCSQLVDQALADAGFHVFDDGRLPQDVVPAELFRRLMELPGQHLWARPGWGAFWWDNAETDLSGKI